MMQWHFTRRRMWPALATALVLVACSEGRTGVTAPDTEALFAKPGPGTWNGSVTSTLADGFSYASDGLGAYTNASSVESAIQIAGDWVLSTLSSKATRRMQLTFSQVDSGTVPFIGTQTVRGRFISKMTEVGGVYPTMQNGDSRQAPLAFAFQYGGKDYRLAMNPANPMGVGTEYALATCTAPLSPTDPTCKSWQLVPTGADGTNASRLILIGTNNSETAVAKVRMSFSITFSR